ncbi:MAG: 50S ribosomal protein L23 [Nitrososphaerales archaeon]
MKIEDASRIVFRSFVTEKTFLMIERDNKVAFLVQDDASKKSVKLAVEALFDLEVSDVNTSRTITGKKAFVRFAKEGAAADLASKLGLV